MSEAGLFAYVQVHIRLCVPETHVCPHPPPETSLTKDFRAPTEEPQWGSQPANRRGAHRRMDLNGELPPVPLSLEEPPCSRDDWPSSLPPAGMFNRSFAVSDSRVSQRTLASSEGGRGGGDGRGVLSVGAGGREAGGGCGLGTEPSQGRSLGQVGGAVSRLSEFRLQGVVSLPTQRPEAQGRGPALLGPRNPGLQPRLAGDSARMAQRESARLKPDGQTPGNLWGLVNICHHCAPTFN